MKEFKNVKLNKSTLRALKVLKSFLVLSWTASATVCAWALLVYAVNYLASF